MFTGHIMSMVPAEPPVTIPGSRAPLRMSRIPLTRSKLDILGMASPNIQFLDPLKRIWTPNDSSRTNYEIFGTYCNAFGTPCEATLQHIRQQGRIFPEQDYKTFFVFCIQIFFFVYFPKILFFFLQCRL